jgi:hypothetical protein
MILLLPQLPLWAWAWEYHHCQNQNQWGNCCLGIECIGFFFGFVFVFEIDNGPIHRISCSLKSEIVSDQYDGVVWWRGVQAKQFIISFC